MWHRRSALPRQETSTGVSTAAAATADSGTISGRRDACAAFIDDQLAGGFCGHQVGARGKKARNGGREEGKRKRKRALERVRVRARQGERERHGHK